MQNSTVVIIATIVILIICLILFITCRKKKYILFDGPILLNSVTIDNQQKKHKIPKFLFQTYHKKKIPNKVYQNIKKYAGDYQHFVYDDNQMTWSSIYGKNGSGPYSQKEGETWSINTGYCPDENFNDNDW